LTYGRRALNTIISRAELIQSRFEYLRRYSEFHALHDHQATDRYYSIFIINTGYHFTTFQQTFQPPHSMCQLQLYEKHEKSHP
jgi:hypothetical protein